jgi:hypothetical protein
MARHFLTVFALVLAVLAVFVSADADLEKRRSTQPSYNVKARPMFS